MDQLRVMSCLPGSRPLRGLLRFLCVMIPGFTALHPGLYAIARYRGLRPRTALRFTSGLRVRRTFTNPTSAFLISIHLATLLTNVNWTCCAVRRWPSSYYSLFTIYHLPFTVLMVDRRGRILVDTGRNDYSATFAAAYTVRARPGAPVSVPCTWEEVERGEVAPRSFTIRNMAQRIENLVISGLTCWRPSDHCGCRCSG
jgi:hypothetical protein